MIIDNSVFNAKREEKEEKEFAARFVDEAMDAAVEMTGSSGPFDNIDSANELCEMLTQIGNKIYVPLANKWWLSYSVSEKIPDDGIDIYSIEADGETVSEFVSLLLGGIDKDSNPLTDPAKAELLCDIIWHDYRNKACIPLANKWYLTYSVTEDMPKEGFNAFDFVAMEDQNNG